MQQKNRRERERDSEKLCEGERERGGDEASKWEAQELAAL